MGNINRRAALLGAAVSTAALAVPAAAAVTSEARGFEHWLKTAPPDQLIDYHLMALAKAMNRAQPGLWWANLDPKGSFVIINRDCIDKVNVGVIRRF